MKSPLTTSDHSANYLDEKAETSGIKQIEGAALEGLTGNKDLAYNFRLQLDKRACFYLHFSSRHHDLVCHKLEKWAGANLMKFNKTNARS